MVRRWVLRILVVLHFVLLSGSCVYALPNQELKAEEIIENHIEAIGGRDALTKIRNRRSELTLKLPVLGIEMKITSFQKRPNKFISFSTNTNTPLDGCDGEVVWEINPMAVSLKRRRNRVGSWTVHLMVRWLIGSHSSRGVSIWGWRM